MTQEIVIKDRDYIFSNIKINKDLYLSEEFKFINSTFSILEALQDIVEYNENAKKGKQIGNEAQWYGFLKEYYNHYNSMRNVFKDYVSEGHISDRDVNTVKDSFNWVSTFLRNVFKQDDEKKTLPHAMNALLAGRFYNRLFYVFKSNEETVEQFLGIEDGKEEQLFIIDLVQQEHRLNTELEKEVMDTKVNLAEIGNEKQLQLAGMWYRTVDFVKDHLTQMEKEIPFS